MSKLVKTEHEVEPAKAFVDAVEHVLAKRIEKCLVCGSTEMDDPQAQAFGVCSGTCAHKLVERQVNKPAIAAPAYCVCLHSKEQHDENGCQVIIELPAVCPCGQFRPGVHIDDAIAKLAPRAFDFQCGARSPELPDAHCTMRKGHRGMHKHEDGMLSVQWGHDPSLTECLKCGGVGSVSVPGQLHDATCPDCGGTGNEEHMTADGRRI